MSQLWTPGSPLSPFPSSDPSPAPGLLQEAEDNVAIGAVYHERNQVVSALSKLFPSSLELDPGESAEWSWVVVVLLPTGQVSWHIHETELPLFSHLPREQGGLFTWDGHGTEQKYQRLTALGVLRDKVLLMDVAWHARLLTNILYPPTGPQPPGGSPAGKLLDALRRLRHG